jgi:prepilin-type processing-associated H-X9-DG protein
MYNLLTPGNVTLGAALADPARLRGLQTPLEVFLCPSDPSVQLNNDRRITSPPTQARVPVATANYIAAHGVCAWVYGSGRLQGAFGHDSRTRFRDFIDGQSSTIVVGERATTLPAPNNTTVRAGAAIWAGTNQDPQNLIGFSGALPSELADCVMGLAYAPMNISTGPLAGPVHQYSSVHEGGAHFLFGDGSVHFLSENMHSHIGPSPATDCASRATWGTFQFMMGVNEGGIVSTEY